MPRIAAIILNWNGFEDTVRCIESLQRQRNAPTHVIVVDNGSKNDEAARLAVRFPAIVVLPQSENLGFARGVNVAIQAALDARAEYVLLVNNDSWFDPENDTIGLLLAALQADPALGAVGPVILNAEPPHTIQSAGHAFSLYTTYPHRLLSGKPRTTRPRNLRPTYLVGASFLISMQLLVELRGFDSDYFAYGEDIDLALRMRRLARSQGLVPEAIVYHRKSVSTTRFSENHTYLMLRSHMILMRKHLRRRHLPTAIPTFLAITGALVVLGLAKGHPLALKGAVRAYYDFALGKWGGLTGERPNFKISPQPLTGSRR